MSSVAIGAAVMAMALAGPASVESPPFSPGIGYTVSQLQRAHYTDPATELEGTEAGTPAHLAPHLPPPRSDLQRIQGSPTARGLHIAAAIAAQLAMIMVGIASVQEQNEQVRRAREAEPQPFRPYPR